MKVTQINMDGLDLISESFAFDVEGLSNIDKDVITNDLFGNGEAFGRSKVKARKLTMNGFILTQDISDMTALNSLLADNSLKTLTVSVDGLGKLAGSAAVTSRGSSGDSRIVSLQLTMPDPYFYSEEEQSVGLGAYGSSGIIFGAAQGVVFGKGHGAVFGVAESAEGTVTNKGNTFAYPVITITGTCSGIAVTNISTGESVRLSGPLSDTDTLVIDCRPSTRGVYFNGVQSMGLKSGAGWIHCPPGDNDFLFLRHSLQNKKHCTVSLRSRWI